MRNLQQLLKVKGTIWSIENNRTRINMDKLATYVESYVVANSVNDIPSTSIFKKLNANGEVEPCRKCQNTNISIYQCLIGVPNKLGFEVEEHKSMWLAFTICSNCKEFLLSADVDVLIEEGR